MGLVTHKWIFKIQKRILLCIYGIKIRIRKTCKVGHHSLVRGELCMSATHWQVTPSLLQPVQPASLCSRLFISLQIQSLSCFLPQDYPVLLSLLSFLLLQQLQTSSGSPSNFICQACLQLDSHLALLWLVYFDLIKMHPSRTLALRTVRLAEP